MSIVKIPKYKVIMYSMYIVEYGKYIYKLNMVYITYILYIYILNMVSIYVQRYFRSYKIYAKIFYGWSSWCLQLISKWFRSREGEKVDRL